MNTKRIEIEGVNKTFDYKGWTLETNIFDIREFIICYIFVTYNIKMKDLKILSESMQILVYNDNLKQKIKIVVTFVEVESKADFNPLFDRINTYKAYINDIGFEMVKTALNVLETEINK